VRYALPHPSYQRPTIQEALCEIHFTRAAQSKWSPNRPSDILNLLKDTYPDFETQTEPTFQVSIGPEGALLPVAGPPRFKLKFARGDSPFILQLTEGNFTINTLTPYPGWARLRAEFERVWPLLAGIILPASVTRIGLRYINRIVRKGASEVPGYWLKASDHIPMALLTSNPKYLVRLELRPTHTDRTLVTISHDQTNPVEPFGSLMFDIDRISETPLAPEIGVLSTIIESLHEDIWKIFVDAKNERLESLLKGEARESAA